MIKASGSSRGQAVARLTEGLFQNLKTSKPQNLIEHYQQYLAQRDGSYMQLETGAATPRVKPDWAELSGYDRIAVITIRAIARNQGAIIPLDVPNRGTLRFLEDEDIIEVPCRVNANGPQPQIVAPIPDHPRELMATVKRYERATVRAALTGERGDLIDALALNPLIPERHLAEQLVASML
jgi:6-phospho-beta-glucosidase